MHFVIGRKNFYEKLSLLSPEVIVTPVKELKTFCLYLYSMLLVSTANFKYDGYFNSLAPSTSPLACSKSFQKCINGLWCGQTVLACHKVTKSSRHCRYDGEKSCTSLHTLGMQ